ncbi:RluA family pseudouridine synthase [Helicobacter sp. 11S02596-1]|uniref:pseudouridine synthase family protein n=1 Tax=Helicobacter sp. 11S02596-1 TaxID=1476194 RepID=UPI000BA79ED0|nr:RluA family pseudouridine synthase [Helicobacter sp. 11S02596-1]PAF45212.1 hypothetical protein BJI48_01235 [Helicobacter sp. 11S02596-1]
MPFVTKDFTLHSPKKSFLFVMEVLGCTQKEAQRHLDKQRLRQNNLPIGKSQTIAGNVTLTYFSPTLVKLEPIFVTPFFAIYDKPPKMLIHPKGYFEHLTLSDAFKSDFGKEANPVHRLDYETSGLVMISRKKRYEASLKALFAKKQVQKQYFAQVLGRVRMPQTIDLPICVPQRADRHTDLGIRCKISPDGKRSITQITPIFYDAPSDTTLLNVIPITGRTHQIRIHLCHIGHKIIGDCLYGVSDEVARDYLAQKKQAQDKTPTLMLHAHSLSFAYNNVSYHITSNRTKNTQSSRFQDFLQWKRVGALLP